MDWVHARPEVDTEGRENPCVRGSSSSRFPLVRLVLVS